MAKKRQTTHLFKRSNVSGKIPIAGDLLLGEVALNTADVKMYTSGTTSNGILQIGWDRVNLTGDTMSGQLNTPLLSATTISATTYYGDGSNLTSIDNTYITGGTFTKLSNSMVIELNNGTNININNIKDYHLFRSDSDLEALHIDSSGDVLLNEYTTSRDDGLTPYNRNLFITNGGKVQVGECRPHFVCGAGRFYLYENTRRWVTQSDDNYGPSYYQFAESGGSGVTPVVEWEHMGDLIPKGTIIKSLYLAGRSTNTSIVDIEVYIVVKRPNPISRWETGMDADGERVFDVLYSGDFTTPSMTGAINDLMRRKFDFNNYVVTEDSFVSIYVRPKVQSSSRHYFRVSYTWELI